MHALESERRKSGGDGGEAQEGDARGAGGGDGREEAGRRRGERSWRWEVEEEIMLREERMEGRLCEGGDGWSHCCSMADTCP